MSNWVKKVPALAVAVVLSIALLPAAQAYAIGASTGVVTGHVKSSVTGTAIANVKVRVFDMETAELVAEASTDDQGSLDLSALPFGLFQVTVVAPEGYASAAGPLVSLTEDHPEATVAFDLELLPNTANAPVQGGGFTFLGLSGGGAIAALIGVVAAAGLATYGIVQATQDDSP